ncbi:hypothetical protein [Halobacillus sp. Cin3]|uniref:hypothetical protein n=1 Tax=Halobacillus sp. Cin3 TaxID=2928441 RepID=UPI00248E54DB|nr:hypothetical protein [Halobacillus sp. Cin3]
MKKSNRQDVEEQLSRLPSIKDHQSREILYQAVNEKLHRKKKRVPSWLGPGFSVCAVLILLAVFIPVFMSQHQQLNTQPSTQTSDKASPSLENPENESSTGSAAKEGEESSEAPDASLSIMEDEWFTFVYPGRNAEVVIPVSTHDALPFTKEIAEEKGLSDRLLQNVEIDIDEAAEKAEVTFPDEFDPAGTAYVQMLMESIRWELEGKGVQTIALNRPSYDSVPMGNYGELDSLDPISEGEYMFKLYQYNAQSPTYLAPVPTEGKPSLEEVLNLMKEKGGGTYIKPSVPDHVEFAVDKAEEGHVQLDISHQEWRSEQELILMIEAVSATARHFGMSRVTFGGMGVEEAGRYDLTKPVDLPAPFNVEP